VCGGTSALTQIERTGLVFETKRWQWDVCGLPLCRRRGKSPGLCGELLEFRLGWMRGRMTRSVVRIHPAIEASARPDSRRRGLEGSAREIRLETSALFAPACPAQDQEEVQVHVEVQGVYDWQGVSRRKSPISLVHRAAFARSTYLDCSTSRRIMSPVLMN